MDRIILHLDMNSYYATLEQQAYPNLRGKPIGVAGKGGGERTVVVGASIEAKKLGVRGAMSTWEARKICPQIIIIPANYDRYSFVSKRIFTMMERFSPTVEVFSIDEAFIELPNKANWEDAASIAHQMKKLIHKQIGEWVTCSIGISYGRTLAKLASELQKPDGLVIIRPEDFTKIAQKTAIEDLCGIGWRIGPRLNQMGVRTINELGQMPRQMLIDTFGQATGSWLNLIGNGIDDNRLRSYRDLPHEKSIGHSYTVPQDLRSLEDVKKTALLLCERVGVRLRNKNLVGRTVSLYMRFDDHTSWGQQHHQKEYIFDGLHIYRLAEKVFKDLPQSKPVRLVAVSISDLSELKSSTQPLFEVEKNREKLTKAVDKINARYGEFTVHRGTLASIRRRIFRLPDGRNKRLYIPNSSPFMKRI